MLGVNVGIGVPGRRRGGFRPPPGNRVVNWRGEGGSSGVPGTPPTGWSPTGSIIDGIAFTRTIIPYKNGFAQRLTVVGTGGGAAPLTIVQSPLISDEAPYDGESWEWGLDMRLAAGDWTNVSTFSARIASGNIAGGIIPTTDWQRFLRVGADATVSVRNVLRFNFNAPYIVNFALDIAFPTLRPVP